jgi:hypothetical protein
MYFVKLSDSNHALTRWTTSSHFSLTSAPERKFEYDFLDSLMPSANPRNAVFEGKAVNGRVTRSGKHFTASEKQDRRQYTCHMSHTRCPDCTHVTYHIHVVQTAHMSHITYMLSRLHTCHMSRTRCLK